MATHSSVLAWRITGMGEPGGLLSMGSHRVGHEWRDLAAAAGITFNTHISGPDGTISGQRLAGAILVHSPFAFLQSTGISWKRKCIHS